MLYLEGMKIKSCGAYQDLFDQILQTLMEVNEDPVLSKFYKNFQIFICHPQWNKVDYPIIKEG